MASKDTRQEKTVWLIVRVILGIALLFFLGTILWGKCGNTIDNDTLACKWTGSMQDIIGSILFVFGVIWFGGLADILAKKTTNKDTDLYGYGSRWEEWKNVIIGLGLLLVGMILIWI